MTRILWVSAMMAFAMTLTAGGTQASTWCLSTGSLGAGSSCATTTDVAVTILPGNLCIGSTGTFNFGWYRVSWSAQTVNGSFVGPDWQFYVDDLRGADSGYYTTVQLNANLVGPNAANIPRANVYMRNTTAPIMMLGTANARVITDAGMAWYQTLDVPRQLIKRNTAANFGVVGRYWVLPDMQLVIPAYQAVGNYTATLTYTLYSN